MRFAIQFSLLRVAGYLFLSESQLSVRKNCICTDMRIRRLLIFYPSKYSLSLLNVTKLHIQYDKLFSTNCTTTRTYLCSTKYIYHDCVVTLEITFCDFLCCILISVFSSYSTIREQSRRDYRTM